MELKNRLSKSRADQLYEPLGTYEQEDLGTTDNVSVVLGDAASYSAFKIEYMLKKLVSAKKEEGIILISHDGSTSYLTSHTFDYFDATPFTGITFGTTLTGGNVNWTIVTSGVDESMSLLYRVSRVPEPV